MSCVASILPSQMHFRTIFKNIRFKGSIKHVQCSKLFSIWVSDVETSLFDTATIFGTLVNQVNYIKKIKRHTRYHFRFRNYKHFNFYHFIASKQYINSHANPYSYMRMQICKCNCLEDMLTYVQTSFHAFTAYFKS